MPATGSVELGAVLERQLDRVADLEVVVLRRVLVDEDAAVGERLEVALLDVDVDELLERQRIDGAEGLLVAVDERRRAAHRGHGAELGDLLRGPRRSSAAAAGTTRR